MFHCKYGVLYTNPLYDVHSIISHDHSCAKLHGPRARNLSCIYSSNTNTHRSTTDQIQMITHVQNCMVLELGIYPASTLATHTHRSATD